MGRKLRQEDKQLMRNASSSVKAYQSRQYHVATVSFIADMNATCMRFDVAVAQHMIDIFHAP